MLIVILCPSETQTSPQSLHIVELWWHGRDPPQSLPSPQHALLSCCPELHHICVRHVWQLSVGPHVLSAPLPPGLLLPCQGSHQPSGRSTIEQRFCGSSFEVSVPTSSHLSKYLPSKDGSPLIKGIPGFSTDVKLFSPPSSPTHD